MPLKLKMRVELKANPNNLKVSQQFLKQAGTLIVDDMIAGIKAQRQLDNSALKENAPSTRLAKIKHGMPPLSLIAEGHRLITRSTYIIKTTAKKLTINLSAQWEKIAGYLVRKGYKGFFGLSPRASGKIMKMYKIEMIKKLTGKK